MYIATVSLVSATPYSGGRYFTEREVPKLHGGETLAEYEQRTWAWRMHYSPSDTVQIPAQAFANAVVTAAKRLQLKVPGGGRALFTKHFEAGVLVPRPLDTGAKREDLQCAELFVPSDARAGGGRRVSKCFPMLNAWEGELDFLVLDDVITKEVFAKVLAYSGSLIGVGRWRPEMRGQNGRFTVRSLEWRITDGSELVA